MGAPEFYPSPAHSPSLSTGSWSSIARKNNEMPSWRPESSRCECSLTIQPPTPEFKPTVTPAELVASEEFIRSILYYAHQLESFQRAHSNFEELKEYWTPEVFGKMVNIIDMAGCTRLDGALRDFHQSIRNNGLWKNWIEEVEAYPRFEDLLLNELAQVLENLSPKYLKDIKIEHLLKIFDPNCGDRASCIQGKKRKLKRQVQKWIETQPDEVLDEYWELVTALKWKLMQVIDIKDKEMEERNRFKSQSRDWRRKTSPPPGLRGFSPRGFSSVGWPAIKDAFDTCGGMDKGSFRGA
jgi:hypothetical protein